MGVALSGSSEIMRGRCRRRTWRPSWKPFDAANRRDADAFIACLSPDVEWEDEPPDADPFPGLRGTYRGRAELREWFEAVVEPWESFHVEIEEISEASGDRVFYGERLTGRGKGSGAETEVCAWEVHWFTGGKSARRRIFGTRESALEAAGLSE
jgi:ketosteroid isomerase-like protein